MVVDARRGAFIDAGANLIGGVASGAALSLWGLTLVQASALQYLVRNQTVGSWDFVAVVVVVLALIIAVLPIGAQMAWFVAASGVVANVLVMAFVPQAGGANLLWLAASAGLVLGGLLKAMGTLAPLARPVVAAGVGLGLVTAPGLFAGPGYARTAGNELTLKIVFVAALTAAGVGVLLARLIQGPPPTTGSAGRRRLADPYRTSRTGPVFMAGVMALVALGLDLAARSMLSVVGPSQASLTVLLNRIGHIATAVVVLAFLLVYAYRRGGPDLARWVVVGFAYVVPFVLGAPWESSGQVGWFPIATLVPVGVVAGVLLIAGAGRFGPWDGLAVLGLGVAIFVTSNRGVPQLERWMSQLVLLGGLGVGVALGAGLTLGLRAAASTGSRHTAPRRGELAASPAHAAGSAGLGFVSLILGLQVIGPVVLLDDQRTGDMRLSGSIALTAAVLCLLTLFWLDRMAARARRREAQRPVVEPETIAIAIEPPTTAIAIEPPTAAIPLEPPTLSAQAPA
jgi:hypothetical protein